MVTQMSLGRRAMLGVAALAAITITAPQAHAGFIVNIEQIGSDVVVTGSGTINTGALTPINTFNIAGFVYPSYPAILFNGSVGTYQIYTLAPTGPATYGSGVETYADSGSGDLVGFEDSNSNQEIALPVGYTSGASLSDSMTFASTTIAALGITPGTYIWTWGSGPTADFFEITTNPAAEGVPEPSTYGFTLVEVGVLALMRKRLVATLR